MTPEHLALLRGWAEQHTNPASVIEELAIEIDLCWKALGDRRFSKDADEERARIVAWLRAMTWEQTIFRGSKVAKVSRRELVVKATMLIASWIEKREFAKGAK